MTLSREEIIAAIAARRQVASTIDVPEWGGTIAVRRMSAGEFEASGIEDRAPGCMGRAIAACLVDDEGAALFTVDDAATLEEADVETMARVFAEVMRVNGLLGEDAEEAVAAFVNAQRADSSSD